MLKNGGLQWQGLQGGRFLPKGDMPLPNGFTALQTEEETPITPGKILGLRQPHLLPLPPAGVWVLRSWDSLGETWSVRHWGGSI